MVGLGSLAATSVVSGLVTASAGSETIYRTLFLGTSSLTILVMVILALAFEESFPEGVAPEVRGSGPSGALRAALADGLFLALLAAGFSCTTSYLGLAGAPDLRQ